jgi:hypothetical protein
MGLFNKNPKNQQESTQETFEKLGVNFESYDSAKIKEKNSDSLKQIATDIANNKWFKVSMALSMAPADTQATVGYLGAMFNQNMIQIRQNEIIIRLLEKLVNNK